MAFEEEDYLQISGLQHFRFCKRQWALIHIEQLWQENLRTMEGKLLHVRAHDASLRERKGDTIVVRDMRVFSGNLGISGSCDVVEFHRSSSGVSIAGQEGLYLPYPVEYKRGEPREDTSNHLQLCAQAMCIEEMLCCDIGEGAIYYGQIRRRETVPLTSELRGEVISNLQEMHRLYERRYTPKVRASKSCNACSLRELCLPKLLHKKSVAAYLSAKSEEDK